MSSENEVEVEEERSLHHLLRRHKANVEDVQALISKYPDEVKKKEGRHNSLPLHTALMCRASVEVVMLLINEYPQAAKTRVEGLLPLGTVLTKRSSDDMVLAVLEAYPEAARKRFSTKFDECILPLHIAYEDKHSEPVKDALRHAYPDAEKENPFETIYLLHKFLQNEPLDQGGDDVENLIEKYPEAVGKRGRDGRLPLHIAIDRIAPVYVTITLFEAYRQAGKEKMEDGRLPIEVFAEQKVTDDWPQEYLTQMAKLLLGNDMPVSIEDGTPKEHSGSWHICISSSTETATSAVRGVLLEFENISDYDSDDLCGFGKHIHALADARDAQGRNALGLASKESREVIHEFLLFCGRYKLYSGPPEHRTATSVVLRAQDLGEQSDYSAIFDEADKNEDGKLDRKELKAIAISIGLNPDLFLKGSDESTLSKETFVDICMQQLGDGPREVAIKLMQNKDQWERECNARTKNTLHSKYVVSALSNVPSEDVIAKAVERGEGGLTTIVTKYLNDITLGKYAFVMHAANRNLQQIFYQEQPKIDATREILRQVFEAVKHLHGQKLMHGDIKMLNIVRLSLDNRVRLIDLDASVRIVPPGGADETFAGAKFSSVILPPEMIERIETEEQLEEFNKYWEGENKDLVAKVAPKLYIEQGIVKARYVVKSFRTDEEGKPIVDKRLPYEELVRASESIDLWSLGVLVFFLLTGETLIPSTRDDDCASGAAMHMLHSWGTQPEVLNDLFKKITDDAAFDLVWKLLQKEPGKRMKVADLLKSHPFFNLKSADVLERRSAIYEKLLLYGRYKLFDGPPEHRSQTSVVFRAQDLLDKQADYSAIFDDADKDGNKKLDKGEVSELVVSKIGLDPELFLKSSDAISKEEFVSICKQLLGDGLREVAIKLMKNKDQWERECDARKKYDLDPKFVVTAQPKIPPEDDSANAKEKGDGGLNIIVEKFLDGIEVGQHAVVMPAADRNLFQMFHQEQPKIDAVREILRQVFEAVKHLHEQKLMHGDIKMANIVRFRIDNGLRLIDLDASARIVPPGGADETFAGSKFSSAVLPPEMIEKIVTSKQLDKFNAYWESENDKDLKEKVTPKPYGEDGIEKARYVVKSFRTNEEGKPVKEGLPYKLERASENIDVWSLGVLAFTLLTGEALIPSNREDDCLSGAAMHLLKSWGTRSDVLIDRFKKIQNDAARDLVWKLLKQKPEERPTVASLLEEHPFFHSNMSAGTEDQFREMKEYLQNITNQVKIIHRNVLVIKELSYESQSELLRTRHVLLKGIFEATEVRTPTTFIILNNKLPPAADPSDEEAKNKILKIIEKEDGSGVSMKTEFATMTATAEGVDIDLEGDLKEHYDRVQDGIKWAKAIKNICTNFAAGNIDEAFANIKDGIKDLIVGNEMYLYLIDDLTGNPVQAEGWPRVITTPSDVVPTLLPLMQLGMIGLSFYNGTAGMARLFGYPLPRVPKAWSKGAQETVELLKQDSSVEEFSVLHEEVKKGSEEKKSVRGESLRIFMDFLDKEDPGLKDGKNGQFAGLQRIGNPEDGSALWTMLTDPGDIESALKERANQRKEEERTQNMHTRQEEMTESMVVTNEDTNEEISEVVDLPAVSSNGRSIDESRDTSKAMATEKKCKLSDAKKEAAKERSAADEEDIAAVGSEETELAKGSKNATAASKGVTSAPATGNVYHVNLCNDCCTIT